jgi:hypothetical protein
LTAVSQEKEGLFLHFHTTHLYDWERMKEWVQVEEAEKGLQQRPTRRYIVPFVDRQALGYFQVVNVFEDIHALTNRVYS